MIIEYIGRRINTKLFQDPEILILLFSKGYRNILFLNTGDFSQFLEEKEGG